MWLLTPEEIITASKETANMPEDWCRLQLLKTVQTLLRTDGVTKEVLSEIGEELFPFALPTSIFPANSKIQ